MKSVTLTTAIMERDCRPIDEIKENGFSLFGKSFPFPVFCDNILVPFTFGKTWKSPRIFCKRLSESFPFSFYLLCKLHIVESSGYNLTSSWKCSKSSIWILWWESYTQIDILSLCLCWLLRRFHLFFFPTK